MNPLLKQARKGFTKLIDENRQTITINIPDDPKNPWPVNTPDTFTGRISHEKKAVQDLEAGTAGLSTNLARYLTVEYDVDYLAKGYIITDQNSKQWKLGPVDPLPKFGGIQGYQAPLEEAV